MRFSRTFLLFVFLSSLCTFASSFADDKSADSFTPVAPPKALGRVLKMNLDQAERWCDENDLASAAKSSQAALRLAGLLAPDATGGAKPRADALLTECAAIGSAANGKNMAQTRSKLAAANASLEGLLAVLPGERNTWGDFKPTGSNGSWMGLIDSSYTDAKYATSADEFQALVYTLAEEANIVSQLRKEPSWRQMAYSVRDTALAAAKESRQDLTKAKQTLRTVYPRCEACHNANRR
jgi:hypothetical protein